MTQNPREIFRNSVRAIVEDTDEGQKMQLIIRAKIMSAYDQALREELTALMERMGKGKRETTHDADPDHYFNEAKDEDIAIIQARLSELDTKSV